MPFIIPETMPADWIVDFAVGDETGRVADAMRAAYARVLGEQKLETLMGRLKAACLAAAEGARSKTIPVPPEGVEMGYPDNAADQP
jgi:hypothetical protein